MAGRTAWVAGLGQGLAWGAAFNTTDISASLPINGASVLSTITIANQTNLDMFMDLSVRLSVASSTIAANANFSFWIATLLDDGSTYGDGQLTAGTVTTSAFTTAWYPAAVVPLYAASAQTNLRGSYQGINIPPESFKLIFQNNSGFTLTSTVISIQYKTYNISLNS